jgi:hypothetical protein
VVADVSALPEELAARVVADKQEGAFGLVHKRTVYLIAGNLPSREAGVATLYHEALGHLGLDKLFRTQLNNALIAMYNNNPQLRAETKAWREEHPGAYENTSVPLARAVEEVLAIKSMNGALEASWLEKLFALIKNFAQRAGMNWAMTDGEVNAILALAHDKIVRGGARERTSGGTRYMYIGARSVAEDLVAASEGVARESEAVVIYGDAIAKSENTIEQSDDPAEVVNALGDAVMAHSPDPFVPFIKGRIARLTTKQLATVARLMPTSVQLDWVDKILPTLREGRDAVKALFAGREQIFRSDKPHYLKLKGFIQGHGEKTLWEAMRLSRLHDVDPTGAVTDHYISKIDVELADPKTTQDRKKALQEAKTNRLADISDVQKAWDALGAQEGGQEIYIAERNYYRDMGAWLQALEANQFKDMPFSADVVAKLEAEAKALEEAETPKGDKRYAGIPRPKQVNNYFPFLRFGDYVVKVVGVNSRTKQRETLHREQFQTQKERDARMAELKVAYPNSEVIPELMRENDTRAMTDQAKQALNKMYSIIDAASLKSKGRRRATADVARAKLKEDLKRQITDAYVSMLPTSSLKKRSMKSENIPGMSGNVLRIHDTMVTAYANQIPKLQYAGRIRSSVANAREVLKPSDKDDAPMDGQAVERLNVLIDEIEGRFEESISPPKRSGIVSVAAHMAYLWMLTAPASAFIQLASLPIRTLPALTSRFGYAKGAATLGKYSSMLFSIVDPRAFHRRPDGQITWTAPTLEGSDILKGKPILIRAHKDLRAHGAYNEILTSSIGGPQGVAEGVISRATSKAATVMGTLFGAMETASREITALSFFELGYEANIAKGMEPQAAYDAALADTLQQTNDALGDYSEVERGTYIGKDIDRVVFQFKQYSINTTKFFLQTAGRAVSMDKSLTFAERKQATEEILGVLLMGGMFHGLVGMPAYGLISATAAMLMSLGEDDDDEARRISEQLMYADDPDWRFRKWLASKFGDIKIPSASSREEGVSLADAIAKGPVSAALNWDIGSRTGFDSLWWREPQAADNWNDWMKNALMSNFGPSVSTGEGILKGIDDINNGNISRGIEKMLPAFGRGPAKGFRYFREGEVNKAGDVVVARTEISDFDIVGAFLGYTPTQVGIAITKNYKLTGAEITQVNKRQEILSNFTQAIKDGASAAHIAGILAERDAYNKRYPREDLMITTETLQNSLEGRLERDQYMYRGNRITEDNIRDVLNALED